MRRALLSLVRDPLFWFFVLGGGCFAAYAVAVENRHVIDVPMSVQAQLIQDHELLIGRKPSDDEFKLLLGRYVDDEILFRESLEEGMHTGDMKMKQRLIEKMRFLLTAPVEDPSDADLVNFYAENQKYYYTEPKYAFVQTFFVAEPTDAAEILRRLRVGESVKGDDYWLGQQLQSYDESMVRATLGQAFVESLRSAEKKQWVGPLQTARGWHFVKVEEVIEPRVMQFVEVREQVVRDWFDDKRSKSINERIAVLKEKYDVEIER
ncbi:MAG TPA: peptidylprolyl isomerase [Steroidobacter sp.]